MARAPWTGSLSFGLVNVPVSIAIAARDLDLHFHQVHEKDGAPIEIERWCSREDVEVPFEQVTHGYELDDGRRTSSSRPGATKGRRARTGSWSRS